MIKKIVLKGSAEDTAQGQPMVEPEAKLVEVVAEDTTKPEEHVEKHAEEPAETVEETKPAEVKVEEKLETTPVEKEVVSELVKPQNEAVFESAEETVEEVEKPSKTQLKVPEMKENKLGSVGIISQYIPENTIESADFSKEENKKDKVIEEFKKYKEDNTVLWARVTTSRYDYDKHGNRSKVWVVCNWGGGTEVCIPDTAYFVDDSVHGNGYSELTDDEKIVRRNRTIGFQVNALVCFCVADVFKTKTGHMVIGDRLKALEILQDYYIMHKNFEATEENSPKIGDVVKAHVLSVKPYDVLVECLGIETHIDTFNLANVSIDNCKEKLYPGILLDVRIRKLHKNQDKPYLTVTGRTDAVRAAIENISVGSVHLGYITKINNKSHTLTVRLTDGVNVSVSTKSLPEGAKFVLKQGVVVRIIKKENTFLMGRIMEKVSN